jgi:hypothetical protein
MKRLPSWAIFCAVLGAGGVLGASCTTHGEGGRCDPGNVVNGAFADCDSNLTCISGQELALPDGGGHPQGYFCCPSSGRDTLPADDICRGSPVSPGSDASIPDGGLDTGTDAPAEAATDAAGDGPEEAATDAGADAADAAGD